MSLTPGDIATLDNLDAPKIDDPRRQRHGASVMV
jgi:hypothetical protein